MGKERVQQLRWFNRPNNSYVTRTINLKVKANVVYPGQSFNILISTDLPIFYAYATAFGNIYPCVNGVCTIYYPGYPLQDKVIQNVVVHVYYLKRKEIIRVRDCHRV